MEGWVRLGVLFRTFKRLLADRLGTTSVVLTLMIVPIVGAVGMAVEGGSWYLIHRAAQNAADAASVAAAINACAPADPCDTTELSATYVEEAAAVAGRFGFVDNDATDIETTMVNCPGTADPDCYQVRITRRFPVTLVRMVGFNGDTTLGGQPAQTIRAVAIARPRGPPTGFCMIGLSTTGTALTLNGLPAGNLDGCDLRSNSNLACHGINSDNGVDYGYAAGTSTCGDTEVPSAGTITDPFAAVNANPPIPTNDCPPGALATKYPQDTTPASQHITSAWTGGTLKKCGNVKLTEDVNVTTADSILIVHNGYLDLNGFELKTTGTGSLTIILGGESVTGGATTYDHVVTNNAPGTTGKITIAAPDSGDLSGIALMQDGRVNGNKNNLDMTYNGNDPQLNIQGLIYLPNGDIIVSGAINKFSTADACVAIIAQNITVNGNGQIADLATSGCLEAGLILPTVPGTQIRQALVQ